MASSPAHCDLHSLPLVLDFAATQRLTYKLLDIKAKISPLADLEELRQVYKPERVRVLFLGESPPAGKSFFYLGNSNLCRYTQEAFSAAFGTEYEDAGDFLVHFWRMGCYLDDLCMVPVNNLSNRERRAERRRGVGSLAERMAESERITADNTTMHVVFAFNYGGRREISDAVQSLAKAVAAGDLPPEEVNERAIAARLYLPEMPDPELIIRTSGEQRLSNFLLWQSAYAELVFTPVLWPDFDKHALIDCILEYQRRDRRFGGVASGS